MSGQPNNRQFLTSREADNSNCDIDMADLENSKLSEADTSKLLDLSNEISRIRNRENLLSVLHEKIKKIVPFNDIVITVYHHQSATHAAFLYCSEDKRKDHPDFEKARDAYSPIGDGIVNRTMESDDPVIFRIDDLLKKPIVPVYVEFYKKSGIKEFVGVSMRNTEGIFGGLYLFSETLDTYQPAQFALIRGLASQLSNTVANILIFDDIQKREKEKILLLSIGSDIAKISRKEELIGALLNNLNTVFSFDHASITLSDGIGYSCGGYAYDQHSKCQDYAIHNTVLEKGYQLWPFIEKQMSQTDLPLVCSLIDLIKDRESPDYIKINLDRGMREVIFAQLRYGGRSIGFLTIMSAVGNDFTNGNLELMHGICCQLSGSVANIIAKEEIRQRDDEKSTLLTISNSLAAVRNHADFQAVVAGSIQVLLPDSDILVFKINTDETWAQVIHEPHAVALASGKTLAGRYMLDDHYLSQVFNLDKPVIYRLTGLDYKGEFISLLKRQNVAGMEEVMLAGLSNGKRKVGLLAVFTRSGNAIGPNHVNLIKGLSAQLATAMANILANQKIEQQVEEISDFKKQLEVENLYLQEEIQISHNYSELIGTSHVLRKVFGLVSNVATMPTTVLLSGETGTGKELIARAIHNASPRKDKLMVKVNCAALPANLIESELFGHEKGSFTGATEKRIGKFELANNGTLFLDEIGEMPWELQSKLLRALQEKEIERIGGRSVIKIDARIIAATNRDLEKEVQKGNFRSDLYFRLNIFPIVIPPLRDRKEDIPMLANHFLIKHSKNTGKKIAGFSSQVIKDLLLYDWPGNVRELEHLVERSILLSPHPVIERVNLPVNAAGTEQRPDLFNGPVKSIEELERDHIINVLKACDGKVAGAGGAAELLKIPSTTLDSKIKKLGIRKNLLG